MRLLILSTEFLPGPGGIGTHAYQIANYTSKCNWQVAVLTNQDYASKQEIDIFNRKQDFQIHGFQNRSSAAKDAVTRLCQLQEIVNSFKPDIIMASGERSIWITALYSYCSPITWVAIRHGALPGSRWKTILTRWAYNRADAIISVSEYTRKSLQRMGISAKRDFVIPNGADPSVFFRTDGSVIFDFKKRHQLDKHPILLTVGNVSERKGQDVVIRAMIDILSEVPDAHYLIVGLPTLQGPLQELAQNLGVKENVHFLGRLDQATLRLAYNACDVFVMTSRHNKAGDFEGFGIAAVEAALCGKPSVVSGNSGLQEAVVDGETGLVVPENNPEETARAIIRLLKEPAYRQQMGDKALQRAQATQTWQTSAEKYREIFEQLVEEQ